jgi:hypothetical protein
MIIINANSFEEVESFNIFFIDWTISNKTIVSMGKFKNIEIKNLLMKQTKMKYIHIPDIIEEDDIFEFPHFVGYTNIEDYANNEVLILKPPSQKDYDLKLISYYKYIKRIHEDNQYKNIHILFTIFPPSSVVLSGELSLIEKKIMNLINDISLNSLIVYTYNDYNTDTYMPSTYTCVENMKKVSCDIY